MSKDDGASILDELDSRLDDFFAEDDSFGEDSSFDEDSDISSEDNSPADSVDTEETSVTSEPPVDQSVSKESNPLNSLKAVVLEMDWEINDENLNNYLSEIQRLINIYKDDRPLYLFFKLHNSIGKYMLSKKAAAHPEALKFLYTVFNSLEKAISSSVSVADKNKMILNEVANFKNLKAKIFPEKYQSVEPKKAMQEIETQRSSKPDLSELPESVQSEINKYIESTIASKIDKLKKDL